MKKWFGILILALLVFVSCGGENVTVMTGKIVSLNLYNYDYLDHQARCDLVLKDASGKDWLFKNIEFRYDSIPRPYSLSDEYRLMRNPDGFAQIYWFEVVKDAK